MSKEAAELLAEPARRAVEQLPRVRFAYGRSWEAYGDRYIGVFWSKKPFPVEGELVYRKWLTFSWCIRFRPDWNLRGPWK